LKIDDAGRIHPGDFTPKFDPLLNNLSHLALNFNRTRNLNLSTVRWTSIQAVFRESAQDSGG
jgi:hypothetical protein